MTQLDLSHNYLRALTSDLVDGLPSLESLDLTDNDISLVEPGVLTNLPKLIHLSLTGKPHNFICRPLILAHSHLPARCRRFSFVRAQELSASVRCQFIELTSIIKILKQILGQYPTISFRSANIFTAPPPFIFSGSRSRKVMGRMSGRPRGPQHVWFLNRPSSIMQTKKKSRCVKTHSQSPSLCVNICTNLPPVSGARTLRQLMADVC